MKTVIEFEFVSSALGHALRQKRGVDSIRSISRATGIPLATLARVEQGYTPNAVTFTKLMDWLNVPKAQYVKYTNTKRY